MVLANLVFSTIHSSIALSQTWMKVEKNLEEAEQKSCIDLALL